MMTSVVSGESETVRAQRVRADVTITPVAATAAAVLILILDIFKYYPLRPATFVTAQFLWPYDAHDWRRGVVSTFASWLHEFDFERIQPVIEFASFLQLLVLALLAQWLWQRAFRSSFLLVSSLIFVSCGFIPHLLVARASQDGYAVIACCAMGLCLVRQRRVAASLLAVLAVAIHEASLPYVIAIVLIEQVTSGPPDATLRQILARPALIVAPAVLFISVAVSMTHVAPGEIAAVCDHFSPLATEPFKNIASVLSPSELQHSNWEGNCGLPLRGYSSDFLFFLRSLVVGSLFAPLTFVAIYRVLIEPRLGTLPKLACTGALLLPSLLLMAAYDTTRFWSYMNGTALFAIVLLEARGQIDRALPLQVSKPVVAGLVLYVVAGLALFIGPLNWERQQTPLPAFSYTTFKTPRQLLCGLSQQGFCSRPVIQIK